MSAVVASAQSVQDLLDVRAEQQPHVVGYTFIGRSEEETDLSFAQLREAALELAAAVSTRSEPGDRVVIGYPSGVRYLKTVFGCLYAGLTPVAGHVTEFVGAKASTEGLIRTARATAARGVITTERLARVGAELASDLIWTDPDDPAYASDLDQRHPHPVCGPPEQTAYIQTTSGSTGAQRGVALSNENLLANLKLHNAISTLDPGDAIVSWLPMSHDMGFVGPLLQPLYAGARTILMSPFQFVMDPGLWLRAISRHRAAISGCPNFGYELTLRRVSFSDREQLDLSCWMFAINGAEPVRPDTLERFSRAFAPAGFSPEAFIAAYGLAEATSAVSVSPRDSAPVVRSFDRDDLIDGRATLAPEPGSGRCLVGHGQPPPGHELLVVESATRTTVPEARVGEIWVSGPSVATGYVAAERENQAVFCATLADGRGPYIRTGDEGFIFDSELHICGRTKDFILQRGVNHAPQDIEDSARSADPLLSDSRIVAVSLPLEPEDGVLLVIEVNDGLDDQTLGQLAERARRAVRHTHGIVLTDVTVTPVGSIPTTNSGKVRRLATADAYLSGELTERALLVHPHTPLK